MRVFLRSLPVVALALLINFSFQTKAEAVEVELSYMPSPFLCDLYLYVSDPQTNMDIISQEPVPPDQGGNQSHKVHLDLPPGDYELRVTYPSDLGGTTGEQVLGIFPMPVVDGNEFFIFDIQIPATIWDQCGGEPNPEPEPDPFTSQVCVFMPEGYNTANVSVRDNNLSEVIFTTTVNNNDCVDITQYISRETPYTIAASVPGLQSQQQELFIGQGSSGNFDIHFTFHLPPDVRLYLSNPDFEEVQTIDAQVGEQIIITAVDVNNPGFGVNLGQVSVNGQTNRSFQLHLQFFEHGSGWGGNSVTFLTEPRDAGLTLELTAKVFVHLDDPAGGDPQGGGPSIFDAGPVFINVAELPSGGGGDVEEVRQELLQLITEVQNNFTTQLQNIQLQFSDGLDAIGNLPVSEGNMNSTLYDFKQKGGTSLQGHFNHIKPPKN